MTISVPVAPFVVLVNVYVPGAVKSLDCDPPLQSGGFVAAGPVPMLPELPVVVEACAAVGFANVTLKQLTLFGVVVAVKVFGKSVVPTTAHVTTAPGLVVFGHAGVPVAPQGLPSTAASVAETVRVCGKKMMPVPDVAVVIENCAVTGSVIVIGNVTDLDTPFTVFVAVMIALPGFTPVTMPVALTVAMDGSLV